MTDKERISEIINSSSMSVKRFSEHIGLKTPQILYDIIKERNGISKDLAEKITAKCLNYNFAWVLTGDGEKLKEEKFVLREPQMRYGGDDSEESTDVHLIPFYDDVSSIGGATDMTAAMNGVSEPSDYIDTGDWFREATAAIRHYGESMDEYPSGCILAVKEVYDRELIIPGRDYVIETSEYRVTKRIQRGNDSEHITAYSTNPETYADGRLIHEPFDIPWRAVMRISSVLGYVVKKNGGTMVFSNQKTR